MRSVGGWLASLSQGLGRSQLRSEELGQTVMEEDRDGVESACSQITLPDIQVLRGTMTGLDL